MRTLFAAAAVALIGLSVTAGLAQASIQVDVGDKLTLNRPAGTFGTSGGEFKVDVLGEGNAPPLYDFSTFCVQVNEFITFGTTYNVFDISKSTVAFDVPLGSFAAWLYTKFLDNQISLLNHQDANAVQVGIWRSMGYLPGVNGDNTSPVANNYDSLLLGSRVNPLPGTLTYQYYNDLNWDGAGTPDANGNKGTYTGDIWIMNLKSLSGGNVQDQLVQVPHMPEPTSLIVWSFLALCCGLGLPRRVA